jgi:uncharacterized phiE125 gp8 family phage protein
MYGVIPCGSVIPVSDSIVTAPQQPPMTVAYAKRHLRSLSNAEDVLVATWILAAASYFIEQTGRDIITTIRERWLDRFPCQTISPTGTIGGRRIELPYPPLQSVVSVSYVDATGTLQTFTDGGSPDLPLYAVKNPQGEYATRGWIEPTFGNIWPIAREESGAVRLQYTSGYADSPDEVPELITGILCYLIGNFDQFRSATTNDAMRATVIEVPLGLRMLLDGFKYSAYPREPPLR